MIKSSDGNIQCTCNQKWCPYCAEKVAANEIFNKVFPNFDYNFKFLKSNKMNQLKAKFRCEAVKLLPTYDNTLKGYVPGGAKEVEMTAVCGKSQEDNQFSEATPFGKITMQVSAPGAKDFIQEGKKYYIYFEECEDQQG